MKSVSSYFIAAMLVVASVFTPTQAYAGGSHSVNVQVRVMGGKRHSCGKCGHHARYGYRGFYGYGWRYGRGTIFTGTRLQFRPFQPVRNAARLVGRVGVRTGRFLTGRVVFPGRFF